MGRNFVAVVGAVVVAILATVVAACTLVGLIPAVPLIVYGLYRMTLEAIDGTTKVSTVWSGTDAFGKVFAAMFVAGLIYLVVDLPSAAVALAVPLIAAFTDQLGDPVSQAIVTNLGALLWIPVLVRFSFALFLIVEDREAPADAFRASWDRTGPVWGKMIFIQLLFQLLLAPSQVTAIGAQIIAKGAEQNPTEALDIATTAFGLQLGGGVYAMVATSFMMFVFGAMYRQLFGAPAQA